MAGDFKTFLLRDPFPPKVTKDLSYQFIQVLVTGVGAYTFGAQTVFNLNGAFQPTTGASHQPYGWDQMTPLYGRYKVMKARVELEFTCVSTDDFYVGAQLLNANTVSALAASTVAIMAEKPMVCVKHLPCTGSQKVTIFLDTPMWDIEGIPKVAYVSDVVGGNYAALVTSNPTQVPTLNVAVAGRNAGGGLEVTLRSKIVYQTEFWERNLEAQS